MKLSVGSIIVTFGSAAGIIGGAMAPPATQALTTGHVTSFLIGDVAVAVS
jgi:hypothetical protein